MVTFASKLAKSAKPPPPGPLGAPKGSVPGAAKGSVLGPGGCGLGGAGLGGGCLLFFGGSAGLGLEGRPGPCVELDSLVGACKTANGSHPNGSLSPWPWK